MTALPHKNLNLHVTRGRVVIGAKSPRPAIQLAMCFALGTKTLNLCSLTSLFITLGISLMFR